MSIYCILDEVALDGEMVKILGVPGSLKNVGPLWDWLGPVVSNAADLRAVFVVRASDRPGTERSTQEYAHPLVRFSPTEYASLDKTVIRQRIKIALLAQREKGGVPSR